MTPRERELLVVGSGSANDGHTVVEIRAVTVIVLALLALAGFVTWTWMVFVRVLPEIVSDPADARSQHLGGTALVEQTFPVPGLCGTEMQMLCGLALWVGGVGTLCVFARLVQGRIPSAGTVKSAMAGGAGGTAVIALWSTNGVTRLCCWVGIGGALAAIAGSLTAGAVRLWRS